MNSSMVGTSTTAETYAIICLRLKVATLPSVYYDAEREMLRCRFPYITLGNTNGFALSGSVSVWISAHDPKWT
jgi:hypothetical protein